MVIVSHEAKLKTNPKYKLCRKWMAQVQEKYYDINPWENRVASH
jgi:hypothetical protein